MKQILSKLFQKTGYEIRKKSGKSTDPKNNYFQIKKLLKEKSQPIIFDVGAHIGKISKIYRNILPTSIIYAFEPIEKCYNKIKLEFNDDSNFYCYKYAITDYIGIKELYINKNLGSSSLLKSNLDGIKAWGNEVLNTVAIENVECITIDSFCIKQNIKSIDLLKLDIQGSEYKALIGAKKLLKSKSIKIIYCEIPIFKSYENQGEFHEILSLLNQYNYTLFNIYKSISHNGQLMELDAMFILSDF